MKILFIGPVGSGKSTQAQLLADKLGLPLVQTGDLLREIAQEETALGQKVKADIQNGVLVDDKTVAEIIKDRLSKDDCQNGFIVDVYPRTKEQLELFNPEFDQVFYIEIPDQVVEERLLKRGRVDDTAEVIQTRLKVYYQQTQPLLDYFQKHGILTTISGEGAVEEIQQKIRENIKGETAE